MTIFLEYTDYGTELVFGKDAEHHYLGLKVYLFGLNFLFE
jgi:hypothetical protein